jgi:hypothetical protein
VAQHPTWLDWNSQETSLPTSVLDTILEEGNLAKWLHDVTHKSENPSRDLIELMFLGIGLVLCAGLDDIEFWIEIAIMTASG